MTAEKTPTFLDAFNKEDLLFVIEALAYELKRKDQLNKKKSPEISMLELSESLKGMSAIRYKKRK